jgi:hypothetical protein
MRTVWTTQTAPIRIACGHGSRRGRVRLVDFRHAVPVILEHALRPVKPREEAGFESAFAEAKHDGPELGIQESRRWAGLEPDPHRERRAG